MEYSTTPATPRRLIRRLVPWTLSLGLFAGGGYGVYSYAAPKATGPASAEKTATADPFAARSSAKAKEQITQLFSSQSSPVDSYQNRYAAPVGAPANDIAAPAPQLPPAQELEQDKVVTPRSAVALSSQNPFATVPVANYGDRFNGSAPAAPPQSQAEGTAEPGAATTPVIESAPEDEAIQTVNAPRAMATEPAEITRGQEPADINPLRSGGNRHPESSGTSEARAAFGSAAPPAQAGSSTLSPAPRTSAPSEAAGAQSPPAVAGSETPGRYFGQTPPAFAASSDSAVAQRGAYAQAEAAPVEPSQAPTSPFATASLPVAHQPSSKSSAEITQPLQAASDASAEPGITPTPGLAAADGAGRPGERILEGLQNPAITIQKLAPAEIQVGMKCTFAVRVQNNSQRTAHNVQVHDEVPLGTQLVGAAPKANVSGSHLTWDLGTLSPGDERIVEMELMPTEEGELGSVATVMFAAQASAKARCTKPQLALRLTAGPRVMIGEQHIVEIEVANPGTGDTTGVMLLETIPAGVSHEAGPALEFEVGTLRPGESRRLDLVLTAEEAGRISNAMTARADASLEVEAVCDFEVVAPDLKVSVDGPKQRYLERPAKYTVSVDNPGTASAKEVQLITQLPKGLQFVSANNMGEYDAATHSVHWSLAELPANERGTVEVTALPVEAGEHTLQVSSRAEQGLEDRTEAHVRVEGLVALSFEVEAADGAVEVGGETAYDVTVVNQGSKPAANVQVVASIPQGLRATNGEGATRHVVQGDKVVFAPLAQLAPKAEAKFRIQVQGLRAGDLRTKIMVTADEVQEPITKEQSTHVYADQ